MPTQSKYIMLLDQEWNMYAAIAGGYYMCGTLEEIECLEFVKYKVVPKRIEENADGWKKTLLEAKAI